VRILSRHLSGTVRLEQESSHCLTGRRKETKKVFQKIVAYANVGGRSDEK